MLAKWLAGKTYFHIFLVEGFLYKDQIKELFIVMFLLDISNT